MRDCSFLCKVCQSIKKELGYENNEKEDIWMFKLSSLACHHTNKAEEKGIYYYLQKDGEKKIVNYKYEEEHTICYTVICINQ